MGVAGVSAYSGVITYYTNTTSKIGDLSEAIKMFEDAHKLSAQELKEEKDWRDMSAEEWDKMLEGINRIVFAQKKFV